MLLSRLLRYLERHRRGHVDLDRRRTSLGDDGLTVEQPNAGAVTFDDERPVERRRQPKRHLDLVRVDERSEPPACVASVRGRERAAEVVRKRDLHGRPAY